MSQIDDIIDYVTTTPSNTNTRILRSQLNSLLNNNDLTPSENSDVGNVGNGSGIKLVNSLPKSSENGVLYFIANDYNKNDPKSFSGFFQNYLDNNFDIESFYKYIANQQGFSDYEEVTEADKENFRTQENLETYFEKKFNNPEVVMIPTFSTPNLNTVLNSMREEENETSFNQNSVNAHYIDGIYLPWAENDHYDIGINIDPIVSQNNYDFNSKVCYYNNDYYRIEAPFKIISENNDNNLSIWIDSLLATLMDDGDPIASKYIYYNNEDHYFYADAFYFYIPEAGNYFICNNNIEFFEEPYSFTANTSGWFAIRTKSPERDLYDSTFDIVEANINDFVPFKTYISIDDIEKMNIVFSGEELSVSPYVLDELFNCYQYTESGLFIYKDNQWNKISFETNKEEFNLIEEIIKEDGDGKYNFQLVSGLSGRGNPINFDSQTNNLVVNYYDIDSENIADFRNRSYSLDLSSLAGQNLYIRNIAYHSEGDTKYQYCYRAYYNDDENYDDDNVPATDTHYFDFYVDKIDTSNYATLSDIPDVSNYATLSDIPDVSNYATLSDIPDVSNFITQDGLRKIYYCTHSREEIADLFEQNNFAFSLDNTVNPGASVLLDLSINISEQRYQNSKYIMIESFGSSYERGTYGDFDWIKIDYSSELNALEQRITTLENS